MKKNEPLIERLLASNAREQALEMAQSAIGDKGLLDDLIYLFVNESYRITQRVSWILVLLVENKNEILLPYESLLLESLKKKNLSDAVKRNVMRIWSISGVSKKIEGLVYDYCISYLMGHEAIAIKVHSMSVAYEIAKPWAELRRELKVAVEDVLLKEGESAGIKSKCKRVLKDLNKEI